MTVHPVNPRGVTVTETPLSYLTPDDLRSIDDLEERARVAGELARAGKDAVEVRDDAMLALLRDGRPPSLVGQLAGVSKSQMTRYVKRARGEDDAR